MDDKLVHKDPVCCCCGRDIPASASRQVNREGFDRPWVFCRRCYSAVPWRDESRMSGATGSNGKSDTTNGQPAKAD